MIRYTYILLMFLGLSFTQAFAQVAVRVGEKSVNTNDEFELPVYVEATVTGRNIISYQFAFSFSTALEAISVSSAGTLTSSWGTPTVRINNTTRTLEVAGAGATVLQGTGNLFLIKFKALSATSHANVSFTQASSFFNEGTPTISTFTNGRAIITDVPVLSISPSSGLLLKGETLQFSASGGTAPYTFSSSSTAVGSLNAAGLFTANGVGTTKVSAQDSRGLKGTTTNEIEVRGFRLSMPDTAMFKDRKLLIPIRTTSLAGLGIMSGDITITHSANSFKLLNVIKTGGLLENADVSFSQEGGTTRVSFARTTAITGAGTLVWLEVEGYATSGLTFGQITFNETLQGLGRNGVLRVNNLPNLSVSANRSQLKIGEKLQYTVSGGTAPYTWSVSSSTAAEISSAGLLTAKRGGTVKVLAQDADGATGESSVLSIFDSEVSIAADRVPVRTTYDLPVRIDSIPSGINVSALELTFSFRKPELVYKGIVQTGALTAGWSMTEHEVDGDTYKIAMANASGIIKSGTLFFIRFELSNDLTVNEVAAVTLDQVLLNEGDPAVLAKSGSITGVTCLLPSAPTVTGGASCGPGTVVLTAAGGTAGNYRWYTSSSGGTPIAGATGATFTTPSLTSTTTYYVSIATAADCESARTPVTATITAIPGAPSVTAAVSYCQNATAAVLTATGSNLKWYTTATGGTALATAPTPPTTNAGATEYFVSQTVNGCEGARAKITVTVNALPVAPTVTPASRCGAGTVVLAAAGGTSGSYRWYTAPNGGTSIATSATYTTPSLTATTTYYVSLVNSSNCEGARTPVVATVTAIPPKPTFTAGMNGSNQNVLTSSSATGNQWLLNGADIPGATGNTFVVTQPGAYSVRVTIEGCSNTSDPRTQLVTGVKEETELSRSLVLYPNPASEKVTVSFNVTGTAKKATVTVYNSLGKALEEKTVAKNAQGFEVMVDTRRYARGSYFVRIDTSEGKTVKAFIIQ